MAPHIVRDKLADRYVVVEWPSFTLLANEVEGDILGEKGLLLYEFFKLYRLDWRSDFHMLCLKFYVALVPEILQ